MKCPVCGAECESVGCMGAAGDDYPFWECYKCSWCSWDAEPIEKARENPPAKP